METKVFIWLQPSKLETYRAHNKTVEKTIFTGLTTKWLSKHICTETINYQVFFFFQFTLFLKSLPNVYSCLASLSVSLPFSLLLFLRHWVSLSLFSRLIHDGCNNPFATCVYIEPVLCLWGCSALEQFVTL